MAKVSGSITDIIPRDRHEYFLGHPDAFIEQLIFYKQSKALYGGDFYITDQQYEVLDSVVNHKRTSVVAGRGVGKTGTLSWLVLWWLSMFRNGRVVCFAPSFNQIMSVLWPEISKWLKESQLAPYFTHTSTKLYLNEDPKNTFGEPRTANKEEAAQGLHAKHLLLLIDEATGVDDRIFEVLQGSLTEYNNKIVIMTNPTRTSGFAYDSHHRNKRLWSTIRLNSEESPIVDKEWLSGFRSKYISGDYIHDMYKIHVQGLFPSGDPDAFITLDEVDKARYRKVKKEGPIEVGVDVARKGDDATVIAVRQGNYVFSAEELGLVRRDETTDDENLFARGQTTIPEAVDMVYECIEAVRKMTAYEDTIRVKVDDTGLGGGVTDILDLDDKHNIEVVPCNFGGRGNKDYSNEASIMWGIVKENIDKIHLPADKSLMEELSTRRWEPAKDGRILIEPKKMFKKDFGSSPDRADALVLCFADKENENRYIKSYSISKDANRNVSSADLRGGNVYCGIYCSNNTDLSAVWASWEGGQLRVFDEFCGTVADISTVIGLNGTPAKIIGSKNIFTGTGDNIFIQFLNEGIFVSESFGYDELGSIKQLNTIAERDALITAYECERVRKQLRTWTTVKKRTTLDDDYGLCYALTLIVSELTTTNQVGGRIQVVSSHYDISSDSLIKDPNIGFMSI